MNFTHKKNERNDFKYRALVQEVGVVGYGVYWFLLEEIYEGQALNLNDDNFYKTHAFVFQVTPENLRTIINACLKFEVFVEVEGVLMTKDFAETKERYKSSGSKGAKLRWKNEKKDTIKEQEIKTVEKPKTEEKSEDRLADLIKQAVIKKGISQEETVEIQKPVAKKTSKKKTINEASETSIVTVEDFKKLDQLEVKKPIKEGEFLQLFNEIKLLYKPNAKGHQSLTPNDKTNLKRLIIAGYTKEDFAKAIHEQMKNKWVKENSMEIPTHVLRNDNFARYLNKSEKSESFIPNQTAEPVYK